MEKEIITVQDNTQKDQFSLVKKFDIEVLESKLGVSSITIVDFASETIKFVDSESNDEVVETTPEVDPNTKLEEEKEAQELAARNAAEEAARLKASEDEKAKLAAEEAARLLAAQKAKELEELNQQQTPIEVEPTPVVEEEVVAAPVEEEVVAAPVETFKKYKPEQIELMGDTIKDIQGHTWNKKKRRR